MRPDQYLKLQALEEKMLDLFLVEAEPDNWPGHGVKPSAMEPQMRGDRYWSKKNAAAIGILANRVSCMIGNAQAYGRTAPSGTADDEKQLDADYAKAEREASKLLDEMKTGERKKAFDRRVHTKAHGKVDGRAS